MIGFNTVGSGQEKVLVLHGWFGDSSAFDPMVPFLDTQTFTYAFMDYRGYGKSKDLTGQYTMAEIAQDALSLADSLGWESFHLIGHSMGGMAIQRIAATAPQHVNSLIGLTPVPASGFPFDSDTAALFRGAKHEAANRQGILMHTTGNRHTPTFGKVLAQRSFEQTTPDVFDAYLTAWSETNFANEVQGLSTPFTVFVGEHDPAITEAMMRATILHWFPNASLDVLPNAGHYPMIETPVALATRIEARLQKFSPVGAC